MEDIVSRSRQFVKARNWETFHPSYEHPLNLDLIAQATHYIKEKIRRTPIEYSPELSELLNAPIYLKLESQQITGSFKVRGALFYLSTLTQSQKEKGIAACSAGNHGLGVAYAAKLEHIACTVYVPKNVDHAKYTKILNLGAKVIKSQFNGYDDTLLWAENEVKKTNQHLITAFDDERIMAGNGGTLAAEILEDLPDLSNIIFPIGGGGLASGLAFYLKARNPSIKLIGCQHIHSPSLKLSLEKNEAQTHLPSLDTIAGGLEGGIGKKCFDILKTRIDHLALLSEHEIAQAFRWALQHTHLIEPSSAITIAATHKLPLSGKTLLLLTGRNIAYSTIQKLVLNG